MDELTLIMGYRILSRVGKALGLVSYNGGGMVAKVAKGRARFRGDHLVPIKVNQLVEALERKQGELGVSQVDLMRKIGLATSFLAVMKQRKQGAVFSTNLKRIAEFLGEDETVFLRRAGAGQGAKRVTALTERSREIPVVRDMVHQTVDFVTRLKAAPAAERQTAEKLFTYLMSQ